MGLLDSLSDGINRGIGQTDRMLQIGRIKSNLASLNKGRSDLYESLGMHVYESNRRAPVDVAGVDSFVSKIREIELEVARLEAELEAGVAGQGAGVSCQVCGAPNALGAAFCTACGSRIEIAEVSACEHCQAPIPPGAGFCTRCGTPTVGGATPGAQPVPGAHGASYGAPSTEPASAPASPGNVTFCSNCGGEIADGLRYCPNCGTAA